MEHHELESQATLATDEEAAFRPVRDLIYSSVLAGLGWAVFHAILLLGCASIAWVAGKAGVSRDGVAKMLAVGVLWIVVGPPLIYGSLAWGRLLSTLAEWRATGRHEEARAMPGAPSPLFPFVAWGVSSPIYGLMKRAAAWGAACFSCGILLFVAMPPKFPPTPAEGLGAALLSPLQGAAIFATLAFAGMIAGALLGRLAIQAAVRVGAGAKRLSLIALAENPHEHPESRDASLDELWTSHRESRILKYLASDDGQPLAKLLGGALLLASIIVAVAVGLPLFFSSGILKLPDSNWQVALAVTALCSIWLMGLFLFHVASRLLAVLFPWWKRWRSAKPKTDDLDARVLETVRRDIGGPKPGGPTSS